MGWAREYPDSGYSPKQALRPARLGSLSNPEFPLFFLPGQTFSLPLSLCHETGMTLKAMGRKAAPLAVVWPDPLPVPAGGTKSALWVFPTVLHAGRWWGHADPEKVLLKGLEDV